jgi:hypothetical protein
VASDGNTAGYFTLTVLKNPRKQGCSTRERLLRIDSWVISKMGIGVSRHEAALKRVTASLTNLS